MNGDVQRANGVRNGRLRRGLWTLATAAHGGTNRHLHAIREWECADAEALRRLGARRLGRLIEHARARVPWYRDRLPRAAETSAAISGALAASMPGSGRAAEPWLRGVPVLMKSDLRAASGALRSADAGGRRCSENTSGGSTGEPVRFLQDADYHDWNRALKQFQDAWTGYLPGHRRIRLWGSERDLWVGRETARVRMIRWLRNEIWLNAFDMSRDRAREYVEVINRFRPRQILAYVEAIHEVAALIEREGRSVHAPRAIVCTGGTLYPEMRDTIERVFRCPTFNRYGSREVGSLAFECPQRGGLHICPLVHHVEVLGPDGTPAPPGVPGDLVVTCLTNYAMPLIRYRIGDVAAWARAECPCGRAWPRLESVVGRELDFFVNRAGDRIHGQYFIHLFYFQDWAKKFRIVQEAVDRIVVYVVRSDRRTDVPLDARSDPRTDPPPQSLTDRPPDLVDDLQDIRGKIRRVMGAGCRVEFRFVEHIAPLPSGKYQYVISHVARPAAHATVGSV